MPISPLRSEQKPVGTRQTHRWIAADCLLLTAECMLLYYGEERGAGGSDSLIGGGASVGGAGRDSSKMARPRLVLRQRENSWQYFASSWAASLRASFSSGDNSGDESDGMKTSNRSGHYTITNPDQAPSVSFLGSVLDVGWPGLSSSKLVSARNPQPRRGGLAKPRPTAWVDGVKGHFISGLKA